MAKLSYVAKRQPSRIFASTSIVITVTPKLVKRRDKMTEDDLETVEQGDGPIAEAPSSVTVDDMLDKSTVSKIVARERQKAFAKGKQEALMELQQQQQAPQEQQQAPQAPSQPSQSMGGMQQPSQADIERMIAEKMPHALQDHINRVRGEQMAESFVSKMQAAEARHPGLESKLNELDYGTMLPLIHMANDMENTGDVMKELVDNPMKMGNLLALAHAQPKLAMKAMQDLSNSIKTNNQALEQEKQARDPMSQLKPSTSAGMDNGAMSVADFRKMFRNR